MNDPSGDNPAKAVQREWGSLREHADVIRADMTSEANGPAKCHGNDKLLCGTILGVVTFLAVRTDNAEYCSRRGQRFRSRIQCCHGRVC